MRFVPIVAVAVAGLLSTTLNSNANGVTSTAIPPASARTWNANAGPPRVSHRLSRAGQTACTTQYPTYSFVGIPGASDVAGGGTSAVLGGTGNQACDNSDAVGAGYENVIGLANDPSAAADSFVGAGYQNTVTAPSAFVGAGLMNVATGNDSFVGAGVQNTASNGAFVGAGTENIAANVNAAVAGGYGNAASGETAFVGGGTNGTASGSAAALAGGSGNTVAGNYGFVGGGYLNSASGSYASIGGGRQNEAGGSYATIAGGANNVAIGELSFASGYHAYAAHTGSFVWSDYASGSNVVKDSADGQFVVRASGGTYVYSSENLASGVRLAAGSGTWSSLSDRNAKTDFAPLDDRAVLAKVAALPVGAWRYKTQTGVRHVGPMAQDFYAAFHVGEDDRHIASLDEDGVALAAIKALHRADVTLSAENVSLRSRVARGEARIARDETLHERDEARLRALEAAMRARFPR